MVLITARSFVSLRDNRGHLGKLGWYYEFDVADAAHINDAYAQNVAIAAAFVGCSNAAQVAYGGFVGRVLEPNQYGSSAQYSAAEDKARLTFLAVDDDVSPTFASFVHYEVPAPKASIFYADGETVNSASAPMVTLIAALLTIDPSGGHVVNTSGSIVSAFLGGIRKRRPLQRKLTIYDKSPNLDEPEE
jgi:hypothetical protein